jgi:hypothetical protein
MRFLKTNTATRVTVGPFLDVTDAKTPEVALTATNEHLTLVVDDGGVPTLVLDANATASAGNNDMVHVTNDDAGYYDLELTAAQLNYVGRAVLGINYVTDHLPVFHEFMILSAQAYDSLFGTGNLSADVKAINAVATSSVTTISAYQGTTQPINFTGTGATAYAKSDIIDIAGAAVSTSTAQLGVNAVQIGAAVPASATIGTVTTVTNQLTAAAIATGVWQDATAGDFTVASSIGKSLYIANVVPGAAGGHFIAGTNAATTVTTALTTTFTGNVTGSVGSVSTGGITSASFAAGAINAAAIADSAIDNATFAADVGSTAFATNTISQSVFKALDSAITDAISLTSGGLLEKVRRLTWIMTNKIAVTDANGNTVVYKDDNATAAYTVNAALTDDSTTTTRLRMV